MVKYPVHCEAVGGASLRFLRALPRRAVQKWRKYPRYWERFLPPIHREAQKVHAWTSEISYVGKVALEFPPRYSGRVAEPGMLGVRGLGFVMRATYTVRLTHFFSDYSSESR